MGFISSLLILGVASSQNRDMESPDEYGGWICTTMLDRHRVALSSLPKPLGQLP
ncbi:MAG: hypothetical protein HC786_00945 [Richelia sp. CSU_2_1]|nr:hypothetical protein [Richelia sp. CSU_2_1]